MDTARENKPPEEILAAALRLKGSVCDTIEPTSHTGQTPEEEARALIEIYAPKKAS